MAVYSERSYPYHGSAMNGPISHSVLLKYFVCGFKVLASSPVGCGFDRGVNRKMERGASQKKKPARAPVIITYFFIAYY